jgi:cytochrome b561
MTASRATEIPAPRRYTGVAIGLHWLMLIALVGAFTMGLYIQELSFSPTKLQLISYHKWAGVTIFAVLLFRIYWRLTHRPPALPAAMPRWQQHLAEATHLLLYVLMVLIPISGWLMSSAKGFQTVWFGLLPLPDLLDKNKELGDFLKEIHLLLNLALAATVFAHAGAAFKHHFINRDDVLTRMLPGLPRRG